METEDKPEYGWILIPPKILSDKTIPSGAKLVFGLCYGLSRSDGICTASNSYIGSRLCLAKDTVSKYVSILEEKELIEVEVYRDPETKVSKRKIYLLYTPYRNIIRGVSDYSTRNINNNTNKKKKTVRSRATNLTDEFVLGLAKDPEFKDMDIETELKMFANYLKSSGKTYVDYQATFKNWLMNSKRWNPPRKDQEKNTFEMLMEKKNGKKFS